MAFPKADPLSPSWKQNPVRERVAGPGIHGTNSRDASTEPPRKQGILCERLVPVASAFLVPHAGAVAPSEMSNALAAARSNPRDRSGLTRGPTSWVRTSVAAW